MLHIVKEDTFTASFDDETGILQGEYGEVVNAVTTAKVYMNGVRLAKENGGIEAINGVIFDFRKVQRFERDNLAQVQRESYRVNSRESLDHIPVGLVVATPLQEQTIRIGQQITPDQKRKRIVKSIEEAHAFFKEWHEKYASAE